MTSKTDAAVGVNQARLAASSVVLEQLEFEAPGGLVVTDDLDDRRLLLVADVEAVLEQWHAGGERRAVDGHQDARIGKVVGRGGRPLQRATQRNQYALGRRQRTGRVTLQLGIDAGEQGRKRKRHFDFGGGTTAHGKQLLEQ